MFNPQLECSYMDAGDIAWFQALVYMIEIGDVCAIMRWMVACVRMLVLGKCGNQSQVEVSLDQEKNGKKAKHSPLVSPARSWKQLECVLGRHGYPLCFGRRMSS